MTTQDKVNKIQAIVTESLNENLVDVGLGKLAPMELLYVIQIGTDILCTKWGLGVSGGLFVQSIADNDLITAIQTAGTMNLKAIRFYCILITTIDEPMFEEFKKEL